MTHTWSEKRAKKAIETRFEEVRSVTIVNYSREMSLENIPVNKAYRMSAAHLYLDIVNLADILGTTQFEGETCHKRALRFLNQHYRAVHRILEETDAVRVDFQNQRLHAIVPKPYGESDESSRVNQAVAIAQLISDVLSETGDEDEHIPNAKIRVGIDTGRALVVNNGRRGSRESLFLGSPANHAAKCASAGEETGIYLTNAARAVIGLPQLTNGKERTTALTSQQITDCQTEAALDVSKDDIVESWREEQTDTPIGSIEFSRPTPPLCELDIEQLTASNSRRFDGVSIYADIDGFTSYIDTNLENNPETLVRCLHVIRSELDRVIHTEFDGRRIRFVGDCVHGLLLEGTAYSTDAESTISTAVLCSGALRSSFECALQHLTNEGEDATDLGLAIGLDFGPISVTRLGMKGAKIRCSIGRSVLASEEAQQSCNGVETEIGQCAHDSANDPVRVLFSENRRAANLDYESAVTALAADGDRTAKLAEAAAYQASAPAIVKSLEQPVRPHMA